MMMLDATKTIPPDGRWWAERWWIDSADEYLLPWTLDEISSAVDEVALHFEETWAIKLLASGRAFEHPIGKKLLFERGRYTADLVLNLARQIRAFASSPGFSGKLNKLRDVDPDEASSVMFELSVAQLFANNGANVRFPFESRNKTPDINVTFGPDSVSVECKCLREEVWEDWASTLMSKVVFGLPALHDLRDVSFDVALHPRLVDVIRGDWNENGMADALSDALVHRIHDEIHQRLAKQGVPFECTIPGVCAIVGKDRSQGSGGVSGMELSSPAIFRRILSNGFEKAALQLPADHVGFVAIFSKHVPDFSFAQLVFDTLMENRKREFAHIAGMIIFTQQYMLAARRSPFLLLNRHCRFDEAAARVAEGIRQQISPVE